MRKKLRIKSKERKMERERDKFTAFIVFF